MFSSNFRFLLESHGLSYKDIGRAVDVSEAAIGTYARGEREPSIGTLIKLANYFHISLDTLLRGQDSSGALQDFLVQLGEQYHLSLDEAQFLNQYLSMPPQTRRQYAQLSNNLLELLFQARAHGREEWQEISLRAWDLLLEEGCGILPVPVKQLCIHRHLSLTPYGEMAAGEREHLGQYTDTYSCFLWGEGKKGTVFYSPEALDGRELSFQLAVNLGHWELGHLQGGQTIYQSGERLESQVAQAEQFAFSLMAPVPVLRAMEISTAQELQRLVGLPFSVSHSVFEKMTGERDERFFDEREERLLKQFAPFILCYRAERAKG